MWIRNGDEPMRVSPLHSMLVRMPRGTTGTRSEPQCAQPARTSTRVRSKPGTPLFMLERNANP